MSDNDLSPKPDAEIEPGEPNPGGVDAIDADEADPPLHDLDPDRNPAVDDALPDEAKEGEDTSTKATEATDGEHEDTSDEESPA